MVRVITFASGKGGTGKTTATVNIGTCLAEFGKNTIILDADIGMANLGLALGLVDVPVTLHEVLAGKAHIHDAIYDGPAGVKVVPSGISLQGFQQANPELLKDVLKDLVEVCDFFLIDAPAGISREGIIPLAVADEVILVVNPEPFSMVDALKTKILTEVVGGHVFGVIVNRAGIDRSEAMAQKMEKVERVLGVRVIGTVPEDPNVRRATSYKTPVVIKFPASPASVAFRNIAAEIAGIPTEVRKGVGRESFIERFSKVLFGGKK